MQEIHHHALIAGTRLGDGGRFTLSSVLGAGGFGITYRACDERLQRDVAIKEYLPSDLAWRTDGSTVVARTGSQQEEFRYGLKRFLDEARTLARFDEPNIVRVVDFFEANGTAYMVMAYEAGEPLGELLNRRGTLSDEEIRSVFVPVLDGLRAVHQQQFLHRDIKPGNIYLRENGSPVLIDFGAAREALGSHSRSVTGIVTAGYAPFEQYSTRGKQGPWTDLYAVGATMYRCISGEPPEESAERMGAITEGEPDPLVPAVQVGAGRYSEALLETVDWLLSPRAADRPQTVEAVLGRLLGAAVPPEVNSHATGVPVRAAGATATSAPVSGGGSAGNPAPPAAARGASAGPWLMAGPWLVGFVVVGLIGGGGWYAFNAGLFDRAPEPAVAEVANSQGPEIPAIQSEEPDTEATGATETDVAALDGASPAPEVEPRGGLQVSVNAPQAVISVNGERVGLASANVPLLLNEQPAGEVQVRVEADGYEPATRTVVIAAGESTEARFALTRRVEPGRLTVRSNVVGDTWYLDGQSMGATSSEEHELAPGMYEVRVEKAGYVPWVRTVTLAGGSEKTVSAGLQPAPSVSPTEQIPRREYLPIVKVAPIYPARAQTRGIEGFCIVEYTVTSDGHVRDPVVLKDQCTDPLFYQTTIEAARKFLYRPRVVDGQAIEVPGVRNKFTFKLEP